jgi:hypothetical protein
VSGSSKKWFSPGSVRLYSHASTSPKVNNAQNVLSAFLTMNTFDDHLLVSVAARRKRSR